MLFDIGIITMDKNSSIFKRCFSSIVDRTDKNVPYQIFVQEGKEREAINFNELVKMFENRFVVYLNDDVEIIDENWLSYLYSICRLPKIALVGCSEIFTDLDRIMYLQNKQIFNSVNIQKSLLTEPGWIASYCWMWDRLKTDIKFDESIPTSELCGKGMTDVDACIAVKEAGFGIMKDYRFRIYHEHKGETEEQLKARLELYPIQLQYMKEKWGEEKFNSYYIHGTQFMDQF